MPASPRESGFTIVEVIVSTLILTLGAMATFGLLSSATKNTQRAKATQVALDRAQQELEVLRGLTTEERALTTPPQHSDNPLNPNYRVDDAAGTFALTRQPPGDYEKLVVEGGSVYGKTGEEGQISGGTINPGPTPFTSGDVSGEVYRYVVWRNDDSCGAACPGEQDFKQVVVAVKLDKPPNQAAERGYVEVQSDFVDPAESAANDPAPGPSGEVVTAQQFFLSDTPCAAAGAEPTQRQPIVRDHLLHNTLGTCDDGPQTGATPGAPDALLLGAPPDPAPADEANPPFYDYADDSYLEPLPDTDKGLQILRDDTTACHYEPTGTTNPEARVHRWVTDPLAADFALTGKVTIEIYSRTLNDAQHGGQLCVYLFERREEGAPTVATDTLFTNKNGGTPYWTYTPAENKDWPSGEWARVRLEMSLGEVPHTIEAGGRLGMALSVERASISPADAVQFMYDHPELPTRIEVDTSTPIDGG